MMIYNLMIWVVSWNQMILDPITLLNLLLNLLKKNGTVGVYKVYEGGAYELRS
ncbi:hypothetical protein ACFFGV_04840 [Pontibacillus salicampi]|uniref:Uncharacterized protein n=1 Tax=Pontibacillus salicampi TaxID=1449801 RepID=A0ABV6LKS3_9BACI